MAIVSLLSFRESNQETPWQRIEKKLGEMEERMYERIGVSKRSLERGLGVWKGGLGVSKRSMERGLGD